MIIKTLGTLFAVCERAHSVEKEFKLVEECRTESFLDNEENCLDSKQSARLTHPPSPHAGTVLAHNCYLCLALGIT